MCQDKDQKYNLIIKGDNQSSGKRHLIQAVGTSDSPTGPFVLEGKPSVSDRLVCRMDLLASLAALTGQSYSDRTDSQNTQPVFLGQAGNGRQELVIEGMFDYAFRQGDWIMLPPYPGKNKKI